MQKQRKRSQIQAGMDCMCIRLAFICVGRGWVLGAGCLVLCAGSELVHSAICCMSYEHMRNDKFPTPRRGESERCVALRCCRLSPRPQRHTKWPSDADRRGQVCSCHIFMPCLSRMQKCRNIYVPLRISKQQTAKQQRVVAVVH